MRLHDLSLKQKWNVSFSVYRKKEYNEWSSGAVLILRTKHHEPVG